MGDLTKILGFVLLLCFVTQCLSLGDPAPPPPDGDVVDPIGSSRCPPSKLKIEQVGSDLRWNATFTNGCTGYISNVILSCPNFKFNKDDDYLISPYGPGKCLINSGQLLHPDEFIEFTYTGPKVQFAPAEYAS